MNDFRKVLSKTIMVKELPAGEIPDEPWVADGSYCIGGTSTQVMQMDWRKPSVIPEIEVILAADVVYARHLIPPLCNLLK